MSFLPVVPSRIPPGWRSDPNGGWFSQHNSDTHPMLQSMVISTTITPTAPPNMVDISSKEIGFKWCIWMYMVYIYAVYCRDTYVNT